MTTANSSLNSGFVSLVGAGPGDPDLLTVKGLKAIQAAEVVVYDRLVSKEILELAQASAEMIYVGKKLDFHCVPQDKINQILVEKAQEGKRVVRLKGGDSFIFGRGGEELEELAEYGIQYEVVPGITAAAGATAYAGIPLTHRDHAQSVQFITGHVQKDGREIEWRSLAQSNNTLVFYMGLKQSSHIMDKLITHGLDPEMSCAIIENGTRPEQRVFQGKLNELSNMAEQAVSPALIVVGSVTQLHNKLAWFGK
ncbi:uroporphyrinogen-III C-methyltransferase [Vibrio parahaemolyticus]|uniref:uroporphyrinogen-III C-methyltransferase n=1 Tax=Vibrio parahaemolyticus TaxID=670 RepID=UPI0009F0E408|nr:uroporphyrinogen-III C-methyltransferase [Vibrio parahaemolyticus]EGR1341802.1 uroporphyrinogen-III C-methyltransferase [Vibrio parahaemolyticus]EIC2575196.1 uroporphyrinogen-III C-methyltransferase [Vibrio parahaemolyticus]EID0036185.1 uroporphyrinogen-III C-methyltransferase [Vibrio parahaemolyticus]EKB1968849.1 uroporphyrinogen-III C-methyltransferase [Vibrio parahaemolyticus]MBM4911610.1 uroporphyrinogen-III C-methyltransferase [Vibrio parahaemolyticus]